MIALKPLVTALFTIVVMVKGSAVEVIVILEFVVMVEGTAMEFVVVVVVVDRKAFAPEDRTASAKAADKNSRAAAMRGTPPRHIAYPQHRSTRTGVSTQPQATMPPEPSSIGAYRGRLLNGRF